MDKNEVLFSISKEAKKEYLDSLIGKMHKILHLKEESSVTGYSLKPFIGGQLFEINAANSLFDGKLVNIVVKVKGIYDECDNMQTSDIKKQIFEIVRIIKSLNKSLEG